MEFYTLFHHAPWDPANSDKPNYYLEKPNHLHSPRKHVILRNLAHKHIARLQTVRPTAGDIFYLRCILSHKPVASFNDTLTVDGQSVLTYQEAATKLGLFAEENEATSAFLEAIQALRTPRQLRYLFIHLLVNDCIPTPLIFWINFADHLSHDFFLQHNHSRDLGHNLTLRELGNLLGEYGKTLELYGFPVVEVYKMEVAHELERWEQHRDALENRAAEGIDLFNDEQSLIYDDIMRAVIFDAPLCLYIDGKAGTGKTFVVRAICDKVRSMGRICLPMATSAFAAQLYDGGRTVHTTFKVPVTDQNEMLLSTIQDDFVNEIGDGYGPVVPLAGFNVVKQPDDIIYSVFPDNVLQSPEECVQRAILAPTNAQVDAYNSIMLSRLDGEERTYIAADSLKEVAEAGLIPPTSALDFVTKKTPPGLPKHTLQIKH
ncbi:hypothetical protein CVT25_002029 [Psilocybe cyanescens]|uniref:ATP-dependent DNA helicase n=1 Tax=Psilocybe cyanescens TaxID=93625 RepID=A0A409X054_PSICY|nr:hypothetical protein CVT25_002029 [Psilocybe cyanescens]